MFRPTTAATTALILACFVLAGCAASGTNAGTASAPAASYDPASLEEAIFAGGCFWCVEVAYDGLPGVAEAVSGYTGGRAEAAIYDEVARGRTEHVEAVLVRYDPAVIDYETLVNIFWRRIDPTDAGGQFADRGSQYETAIFVGSDEERAIAERTKRELAASGRFDGPIVTPVLDAGPFYPAEAYHQDYARKNPTHYKRYAYGSGREPFLERIWGDEPLPRPAAKPTETKSWRSFETPSDEDLRRRLTPEQYHVTQEDGTERPFANEFWDHKQAGIYVDVVSGEPLFSSIDKFKSGTGWPSFTRPLRKELVVEVVDTSFGIRRVELRSAHADSHLGHLFEDGPPPTGLRYCVNSAALRFVPAGRLAVAGYAEFASLFEGD